MDDTLPLIAGATTYQVMDMIGTEIDNEDRLSRMRQWAAEQDAAAEAREILRIQEQEDRDSQYVNALDFTTDVPDDWDDYVGQESLKYRLRVAIESAKKRGQPLDHVLLASGMPGVGKTTMARLIALAMGSKIIELVPPFSIETLAAAAKDLRDGDVLFIDEIHKLADNGKRGAEILLKLLEERCLFLGIQVIRLAKITVIGATTDVDMLPEPVIDRFKIKPYFEKYTLINLCSITCRFMEKHDYDYDPAADEDLIIGIAAAARSTPRVCEEFVMAARDLKQVLNRKPTIDEVLDFQQVEPDGMTRQHIAYLVTMLKQGKRTRVNGDVEYVAGEAVLMSALRETKNGVQRIERFLMELGYLERTPSGRRLTHDGIDAAMYYNDRP